MARPSAKVRMAVWLIAVTAALVFAMRGAKADELRYVTFHNERFGTTIDYPPTIFSVRERAPENDDGRAFHSADMSARFTVSGRLNVTNDTLEEIFAEDKKFFKDKGIKITYAKAGDDWFVITGIKGGEICYERILLSSQNQIVNTFWMEYPSNKKGRFDSIVSRMARSLRSGDGYVHHFHGATWATPETLQKNGE